MPKSNYRTINLKPDTKARVDELADELGGIETASHDAVVRHLIEEAGYEL